MAVVVLRPRWGCISGLGSLQQKGSGLVPRTSPALVIGREDPAGPLSWDLGDQLSP